MSKDRLTPCVNYVCEHQCTKGKDAQHNGLCQHCRSYKPRARVKHINEKKEKLQKLREKEIY